MADNKNLPGTGTGTADIKVATRSVTYSGDTADVQTVGIGVFAGSDDAKTVTDVSAAAPLPVLLASEKVEDVAGANGDTGILILGQRNDGPSSRTSTDGDYSAISVDDNGRVRAVIDAFNPVNIGAKGDVAHDGVDSGNPVKVGGYAKDAAPTDVSADGDRVNAWFLRNGALATALTAAGVLIGGDAANGLDVDVTRLPGAPTGTLANVSGSASSVTLQASNTARKGLTIWNDSTSILYIKFGTTASATSATAKLVADAYYEVPYGYTGIVTGIWVSATGNARVTEIT